MPERKIEHAPCFLPLFTIMEQINWPHTICFYCWTDIGQLQKVSGDYRVAIWKLKTLKNK